MKKLYFLSALFALPFFAFNQVIWQDDFNDQSISDWGLIDSDGDGNNWRLAAIGVDGSPCLISNSWFNNVILTPDNYAVSPSIDLTGITGSVALDWRVKAADPNWVQERYQVIVSQGNTIDDINAGDVVLDEVIGNTNNEFAMRRIDLSSYIGGEIYISFRHFQSSDQFVISIDDVVVSQVELLDASLIGLTSTRYYLENDNINIALQVNNAGLSDVNSVTASYSVNGAAPVEETFNVTIEAGASQELTFSQELTASSLDDLQIDLELISVNSVTDGNPANNSATGLLQILEYRPEQGVLVEEATGTWCQWCPRGHVFMELVEEDYPEADLVAVHGANNDPMENTEYFSQFGAIIGGFPSGIIDRIPLDVDPSNFPAAIEIRRERLSPVDLSLEAFNNGENQIVAELSTKFLATLEGEYRMAILLVENGVTGPSPSYDQVNAYAGGASGVMGGYENLPNPVPAADMVYNNVLRTSPSGFSGQEGSIPTTTIARNDEFNYTWTIDIPSGSDADNLYLVAFVLDMSTGISMNSTHLLARNFTTSVANLNPETASLSAFPNPFQDFVNINVKMEKPMDVQLTITDMVGNTVASQFYNNVEGNQIIQYPTAHMSPGIYMINMFTEEGQLTEKVVLAR